MVFKPEVKKLNDILHYNTTRFGLQELLRYADINSMANSREVRLPFLNHELVQFIFSLPASMKIHEGSTKWILRKSMERALPPDVVWRKDKVGFEPPQHSISRCLIKKFSHRRNLRLKTRTGDIWLQGRC
jgi:asparagine synthase (glutamine-hydrolysing)